MLFSSFRSFFLSACCSRLPPTVLRRPRPMPQPTRHQSCIHPPRLPAALLSPLLYITPHPHSPTKGCCWCCCCVVGVLLLYTAPRSLFLVGLARLARRSAHRHANGQIKKERGMRGMNTHAHQHHTTPWRHGGRQHYSSPLSGSALSSKSMPRKEERLSLASSSSLKSVGCGYFLNGRVGNMSR